MRLLVLAALCASALVGESLRIPVWVDEPAARPDFAATLNGKAAAITSVQPPGSDEMILVVLDLTGDIALIDAARTALGNEIEHSPANAWVGLLRTQDGLRVLADPGPDRKPLLDAIQSLPVGGHAGLLDTVESAVGLGDGISRKSPARISVLYITDSDIYNYREDYSNPVINESDPHDLSRRFPEALVQEKISKLQQSLSVLQTPLFIVHLNYRAGRLNQAYQNGLKVLTDSLSGETTVCRSPAEIPSAIHGVFQRIHGAWSLTLALPPNPKPNVLVHLTAKSPAGEIKVFWRQRLTLRRK